MIKAEDYLTYSDYMSNFRTYVCTAEGRCGVPEHQPLVEWEWMLLSGNAANDFLGMTLTAETENGMVTITDVRPDSVILKELRVEHADGTWGKEYVLSCEEVSGDRIRYVPGVVQWWTE